MAAELDVEPISCDSVTPMQMKPGEQIYVGGDNGVLNATTAHIMDLTYFAHRIDSTQVEIMHGWDYWRSLVDK